MKKQIKWHLLALAGILSSCAEEAVLSDATDNGTEITTTIGIQTPQNMGSRAVPEVFGTDPLAWAGESGYPSIGNVDLKDHPLSYTVGIYVGKTVEGVVNYTLVDQQSKVSVASDEAYFNFRLIKGQTYKLVAYADFASTAKDNLQDIAYRTDLNNELDDAFFVSEDFVAQEHVAAILKRPFGKLRLIARDFNIFAAGEKFNITDVKVSYKGQPMLSTTKFNALTGEFNYDGSAEGDVDKNNKAASYAAEFGTDKKATYATIFTHYLPANFGVEDKTGEYSPVNETLPVPQSWMYPFDITITYQNENGEESTLTRSYDLDIPVKRNWLTTIDVENFWTDNSGIKLTVDHRFDGFITEPQPKIIYVNDEDEMENAIEEIKATTHEGKIILGHDIVMEHHGAFEIWDNNNDLKILVDLNGYKIEQKTMTEEAWAVFDIFGPYTDVILTIEDTSKEATGAILSTDPESCYNVTTIFPSSGGQVIINGGTIKACDENAVLYTYDTKYNQETYNFSRVSIITVNGGWFENIDGATYKGVYGLEYIWDALVNIYNNDDLGIIHLNGGSYVGYDPRKGDNICGNATNKWVDDDHEVVEETINGMPVYTVIAKENPSYY